MPIPDFVRDLRELVGTHPLWLPGAEAVVTRGEDVLLIRRADSGEWAIPGGGMDPGEQPADAAMREVLEETGVRAEAVRLVGVDVTRPVVYGNGDRAQYVNVIFLARWVSGEPHPADGEATAAEWFRRDALPPLGGDWGRRLEWALSDGPARFLSTASD